MRAGILIPQSRLMEVLQYDATTGVFTRRLSNQYGAAGSQVGRLNKYGYLIVCVDRKWIAAHRLAWLYVTGKYPTLEIDHINGIKTDNRFENLRHVSRKVNAENVRQPQRNNKTGFLGVSRPSGRRRFISTIVSDGRQYYLGAFDDAETAHAAYVSAKKRLHKGCAI